MSVESSRSPEFSREHPQFLSAELMMVMTFSKCSYCCYRGYGVGYSVASIRSVDALGRVHG